MNIKRKVSLFVAWIALCVPLVCAAVPAKAAGEICTSEETAAQLVRETMVNREAEIEIIYPIERAHLNEDEIMALVRRIYDKAIEHTGEGNEGDYLYFHESEFRYGYGYRDDGVSSSVNVNLTFGFSYYTDAVQEAKLTAEINTVLSELKLAGKSDYEKVRAIFDYICKNVEYDYANLNNEAYQLKYSAYAALCNGTSVCQGYANLFYRLANEAGLDARIVSGTSKGQNHAWNIVKVDGKYYNIDATWDAVTKDYSYFLKGSANFDEHTPGGDHPANYSSYNISTTDYVIPTPEKPTEESTEAATEAPTEAPTQTPTKAPTQASTEDPTEEPTEEVTQVPTEGTTEAVRPTETTGEKPMEESTEASTKEPVQSTTEAATKAPADEPTEAATSTESTTEADNTMELTTEAEESTEELTEAEVLMEETTKAEEPAGIDKTEGQDKSEETTAEKEDSTEPVSETEPETPESCGMPDGSIPTESGVTDEMKEKPKGMVVYLIVGAAGVGVVGTGVVVGRKMLKKRKMN